MSEFIAFFCVVLSGVAVLYLVVRLIIVMVRFLRTDSKRVAEEKADQVRLLVKHQLVWAQVSQEVEKDGCALADLNNGRDVPGDDLKILIKKEYLVREAICKKTKELQDLEACARRLEHMTNQRTEGAFDVVLKSYGISVPQDLFGKQ